MIINSKYLTLIVLIYVFIFYPLLEIVTPVFSYWDEVFVLLFFTVIFSKKNKISRLEKNVYKSIVLFIVAGIIGTIIYRYQPIDAIVEDIISFIKFPCALFFTTHYFDGFSIYKYKKKLCKHLLLITLILSLLLIFNNVIDLFDVESPEMFLVRGEKLFYSHATYLASNCAFLISFSILMFDNKIKRNIVLFMLLILSLSTSRIKVIGWLGIVFVLWSFIYKRYRKFRLRHIFSIVLVAVIIGRNQLYKYFVVYANQARGLLYVTSLAVFRAHFPWGAGFATFGSAASSKVYSPLYDFYGLSKVYGFINGGNGPNYISDSFWPIIAAESGIFGLIMYLYFLSQLFKWVQNIFVVDKRLYFSALIALAYMVLSSVAESAFVNCLSIPYAFLLGIIFVSAKNKREDIINESFINR